MRLSVQNIYVMISMLLYVLQIFIMNKKRQISFLYIKSQNYLKKIIDLLVSFQISPRFMKDAYMIKWQNFLIISFQSISMFFERVTAHNTAFSYDREMEKGCTLWRCLCCIISRLILSFWLHSGWPYHCQTGSIWFSNRRIKTCSWLSITQKTNGKTKRDF